MWVKPSSSHLGRDEPGPGVVGDAVARQVPVGPGRAVARDGAEHDLRVDRLQVLVAEAPLGQGPGAHGLDHGVGAGHELLVDGHALVGLQVEGDRLLAPVDVEVQQRDALDDRPGHLADVVALGRLDLDDVGAEVGEEGGDQAGAEQGALDDADTGEQGRTVGHGWILSGDRASRRAGASRDGHAAVRSLSRGSGRRWARGWGPAGTRGPGPGGPARRGRPARGHRSRRRWPRCRGRTGRRPGRGRTG